MSETLFYPAIFHPEEVGYSIFVPDIDGCLTQGDTLEDAYAMAADALSLCLEDICANGQPFPAASRPESLALDAGDCIVLVRVKAVVSSSQRDTRAVKKTLTIPAWLNTLAAANHINFSKVLQSALLEKLGLEA